MSSLHPESTADEIAQEMAIRARNCRKVIAYFRAHENCWIPLSVLAKLAGIGGFRTRISESRSVFRHELGWPADAQHDPILNRQGNRLRGGETVRLSWYCYRPYLPLGRSADMPSMQPSLLG